MPDQNFLSPTNFAFTVDRLPQASYFVQDVNIPGVSMGDVEQPSPFKTIYRPGDKLMYNELTMTVRADENMVSFIETYNWIVGLSFPDNFDQYANLLDSSNNNNIYSDATLIIKTNAKNPNITMVFKDLYPNNITDIQLSSQQMDIDYATFDITFRYNGYDIKV